MDPVVDEMDAGLADGPVPSSALASGEFVGRAVHAHEEDVECGQHHGKLLAPLRMFDDVVDDQVIARSDLAETSAGSTRAWTSSKGPEAAAGPRRL